MKHWQKRRPSVYRVRWKKVLSRSFVHFVVGLRVLTYVCKCRSSRDEGLFLIRAKALIITISFACKEITPKPFSTFDPRAYFFSSHACTNIMWCFSTNLPRNVHFMILSFMKITNWLFFASNMMIIGIAWE